MLFFKVVILKKNGSIKTKDFTLLTKKKYKFNLETLQMSKHIKKSRKVIHTYNVDKINLIIIGSNKGKHTNINKHELPPPIDNNILYNDLIVIKTDLKNNIQDLTKDEYDKYYETLFGGFEELGSEDTDTDDEGYVKIKEEDYDPDLSDEENIVNYDKYYNSNNKNDKNDLDSFIVEDGSDYSIDEKKCSDTESIYSDELSETESDEELRKQLEDELYDSE